MKILDPATVAVARTARQHEPTPLWPDTVEERFRRQLRVLDVETAVFDHDTAWS